MGSLRIPPSNADRWGAKNGCRGNPQMLTQVPVTSSPYADEGRAAHELAARLAEASISGMLPEKNRPLTVGYPLPNGTICTDEMFDAVEVYVLDILGVIEKVGLAYGGVETPLEMPTILPGMMGTVDRWIYDPASHTLYVWDFKYGRSLIEVFENLQLVLYAIGVIHKISVPLDDLTIDLRIAQPRGFHKDGTVRSWVTDSKGIDPLAVQLRQAAQAANTQGAPTTSGPYCKNCDAVSLCPSAQQFGLLAMEYSNLPIPVEMDGATLGTYLTLIKRAKKSLEDIDTGLSAQAKTMIKLGESVTGFGVEPTYHNLDWTAGPSTVKVLEGLFNRKLFNDKPLTPTQALKEGIPAGIIEAYSDRKRSGEKLVADDGTEARRIFSQHRIESK